MIKPNELPRNVIVPAGNWERGAQYSDIPQLSKESIMRVNAAAILGLFIEEENMNIIFSGGLTIAGCTEAQAMSNHFENTCTATSSQTNIFIDNDCHNTTTSARSVKALTEECSDIFAEDAQYTLIVSKTFAQRADGAFKDHGFAGQLTTVSAEDLLLFGDSTTRAHTKAFMRSSRYKKRVAAEFMLRIAHSLDPGDKVIEWSSGLVRPNRQRVSGYIHEVHKDS